MAKSQKVYRLLRTYRLSLFCIEVLDILRVRSGLSATAVIETAVREHAARVIGERDLRKIQKGIDEHGADMMADRQAQREVDGRAQL